MQPDRGAPRWRIGLTGGIAAGKSVVAARLGELGAVVIDHDILARAVLAPGSDTLAEIVAAFGPDVLTDTGSLDRPQLARVVFAESDARARLNAIVHPVVARAADEQQDLAVRKGAQVVVHDIPLLVETGQAGHFDEVVVVEAPAALRVERLVVGRGMSTDEAWARLAAQADDETRSAAADVRLDGSGSVDDLRAQVDRVWHRWTGPGPQV